MIDLVIIFRKLSKGRGGLRRLKTLTLIELGPGPTKLSTLKRMLFKEVLFIDQFSYDGKDKVIIADLSIHIPLPYEVKETLKDDNVLYFADHCVEHLPIEVIYALLKSYVGLYLFRVPNIRSKQGLKDFHNDSTHRTEFNDEQIEELRKARGVKITFWNRFYSNRFEKNQPIHNTSREICLHEF